jgi:hypothetical protein
VGGAGTGKVVSIGGDTGIEPNARQLFQQELTKYAAVDH